MLIEQHNGDALNALYKIKPAQENLVHADLLMDSGDYTYAIQVISKIIEVCPWAAELRERRAKCHEALQDYISAISDVHSAIKLQSDNTQGYFKVATLHYQLGQVDESLK